jgi:hypothetical protein
MVFAIMERIVNSVEEVNLHVKMSHSAPSWRVVAAAQLHVLIAAMGLLTEAKSVNREMLIRQPAKPVQAAVRGGRCQVAIQLVQKILNVREI